MEKKTKKKSKKPEKTAKRQVLDLEGLILIRGEVDKLIEGLDLPGWENEQSQIKEKLLIYFKRYLRAFNKGDYAINGKVDYDLEASRLFEQVMNTIIEAFKN